MPCPCGWKPSLESGPPVASTGFVAVSGGLQREDKIGPGSGFPGACHLGTDRALGGVAFLPESGKILVPPPPFLALLERPPKLGQRPFSASFGE